MCTVLLPPGDNPIAVHKYININIPIIYLWFLLLTGTVIWSSVVERGRCIKYFSCKKNTYLKTVSVSSNVPLTYAEMKWIFPLQIRQTFLCGSLRRCPEKIIGYINLFILFYFLYHVVNNKHIFMTAIIYLCALINIYIYLIGSPAQHNYTSLSY